MPSLKQQVQYPARYSELVWKQIGGMLWHAKCRMLQAHASKSNFPTNKSNFLQDMSGVSSLTFQENRFFAVSPSMGPTQSAGERRAVGAVGVFCASAEKLSNHRRSGEAEGAETLETWAASQPCQCCQWNGTIRHLRISACRAVHGQAF